MSIATAFDRAIDYDRHARVQRLVADSLAEHIVALPLPPFPRVLEIGCGTGLLGAALLDRLQPASWLMTDIAPAMVARARLRFGKRPGIGFATMDGQQPQADGPFDLICSSLSAQWFADLPAALARWRALLAPSGRLAFTTLAAGSFDEWRLAHGELRCGLHDYPAPEELAGLGLEVTLDRLTCSYGDARAFLQSVKRIGAGSPRAGHRPLSPGQLHRVMHRFDAAGARATYVVATCVGEKGA